MPKIDVYNQKGEKVANLKLNPAIFAVKERPDIVHQAVLYQLALKRAPIANTKTRSEVRGGGRKPWRQKGTGRARAGSIRSPLWKGGGVVFGPTSERNFKKKMPKKMKRLAIFSVLSNKVKSNKLLLLDKIEFKEIKTKLAEEMLSKLPIKEGTILFVLSKMEPKFLLSANNLPYLKVISVSNLNVIDLLKYDFLIFTVDAIKKLEERYIKE